MPFTYNTPEDEQEMLAAIGVSSIDELFEMVPESLRLGRPLDLPPAMGEMELDQHLNKLAEQNLNAATAVCFLGGGSYDHFVPAVVDVVASRSEFYTSYTPYQAEVAQGNLQAMFEYQSMIVRLTGLDVSNSSLYDGASAAAEGVLMSLAAGGQRKRVVLSAGLHPEYRETIATYVANLGVELVTVPTPNGVTEAADLIEALDDNTACVVVQQPNFFGCVEDAETLAQAAHDAGALVVAAFDPISLGLLKRPGDWGADIAVCEGQSLGTAMQYGGPYLGVIACSEKLVRRMPGRIVGKTTDRRGKPCYVLTLQTREQHIRRDKATSNVCTNQALFALRATVYLALLGPEGLKETANLCLQKSRYLAERLCESGRFERAFDAPTFKEFVIRDCENDTEGLVQDGLDAGYLTGVPLGRWYPELADCLLIAVTEKRTKAEIDRLVEVLVGNPDGTTSTTEQEVAVGIG
ncbi:putative glycine dehydrogenase (decarboxylating) subunit 1 [Pseudobythopirellula maris]|uniref:Probable glycine dehydrogenase (decarboxylating) subunit 1 n=1 Tax=Pseudobythopirellula maris TaxID=2527991 RepID=A0A5C5ZFT7_9BACT|nr:aminomethyl-transferring glycine dehydrogenase subunit GcvPA [Pseudobythopirellula maris]TWT86279.1 putative glycine dehydrogenase (decarboxylating) subunit 1 [Pseudobythopirellula maris]